MSGIVFTINGMVDVELEELLRDHPSEKYLSDEDLEGHPLWNAQSIVIHLETLSREDALEFLKSDTLQEVLLCDEYDTSVYTVLKGDKEATWFWGRWVDEEDDVMSDADFLAMLGDSGGHISSRQMRLTFAV